MTKLVNLEVSVAPFFLWQKSYFDGSAVLAREATAKTREKF